MFQLKDAENQPVIKVIGIGGGAIRVLGSAKIQGLKNVESIAMDTDSSAFKDHDAKNCLLLGPRIAKGVGAGADLGLGQQAALESAARIRSALAGTDFLILVAAMGGGTGTGAISVVATIARELGIFTVAVVTSPFSFEGSRRTERAQRGIDELGGQVNCTITIPNHQLWFDDASNTLINAFKASDHVVAQTIQAIADPITRPGLINVDLDDIMAVLRTHHYAAAGFGTARGPGRARNATEEALRSPLLAHVDLSRAYGLLVNITAGLDLSIGEFEEVGNVVKEHCGNTTIIVVGTVIDPGLESDVQVSLVVSAGEARYPPPDSDERYTNVSEFPLSDSTLQHKRLRVVASDSTNDDELADLIVHLSNVYRSVGGDELVVEGIHSLPPDESSKTGTITPKRRAVR